MKTKLTWVQRYHRFIKRQKKRTLRHVIIGLVVTFLFIQLFD